MQKHALSVQKTCRLFSLQPFPVGRAVRHSDRGGAIIFHVKKRPNIFISVVVTKPRFLQRFSKFVISACSVLMT